MSNEIYQFKIELEEIKPKIWRRIQVPERYNFWELHVAIQDAMGWLDYHLHEFRIMNMDTKKNDLIGIPDGEYDRNVLPGWEIKISKYFSLCNQEAEYEYDFGDSWVHKVILEKILPADKKLKYPLCVDGKRACPPEDCGSIPGYESFVKSMRNKSSQEYKENKRWFGKHFDSEAFDPRKVKFDSPLRRFKRAFEDS